MLYRRLFTLLIISATAGASFMVPGCANIQAPMGGSRDTLPPVLVKAVPVPNSTKFGGNTINLQFDEYIQLDNVTQNLVINPPPENYPVVESKLRNLSIKLKDTLQANTTYTLNFGKAIKDVNENNLLKNFTYTFSTGSYIDSLWLGGLVLDAESGLPDSTLIIMLHRSKDDSAVAKQKPSFVTRPNGKGIFRFDHLPEGQFYLFAIKDEGAKKYTNLQTPFAFYDSAVNSKDADSSYELRAFIAEKEAPRKSGATPGLRTAGVKKAAETKLKFSTPVVSASQDLLSPLILTFNKPVKGFDTAKILLTDTLLNAIGGLSYHLDSNSLNLEISAPWKENESYRLQVVKGFATDTSGAEYSKNDTLLFKTTAETEYGLLLVKFKGVNAAAHPVLQWTENNKVVLSTPLTGNQYRVPLFRPGQYKLRILYDANQNGIWDTGNYWKKLQPERILAIDQAFNIKANWENEYEVSLQ